MLGSNWESFSTILFSWTPQFIKDLVYSNDGNIFHNFEVIKHRSLDVKHKNHKIRKLQCHFKYKLGTLPCKH